MIVGAYRDLVLPVSEMPVIFQQPDIRPIVRPGQDFFVPEVDGLNDYTNTYESVTGNVLVGVVCRQAAYSAVTSAEATWGGVPMELVAFRTMAASVPQGGVCCALFGIRNGLTGTHDFNIKLNGADFGFGGVQVDDVLSLTEGWNVSHGQYGNEVTNYTVSGVVIVDQTESVSPTNVILGFGGALSYGSYPITCQEYDQPKRPYHVDSFRHEIDGNLQISYSFNRTTSLPRVKPNARLGFSGVNANAYAGIVAEINGVFE